MPFAPENESNNPPLPESIRSPAGSQDLGPSPHTEVGARDDTLSVQAREQIRQLELLNINQENLARLFAGLPTFDTVIKNLLISTIKAGIAEQEFRNTQLSSLDPDDCYVNHFILDSSGRRSLTSSRSFTQVLWDGLLTDTPPAFSAGVGFFSRPDSVDEADSLLVGPVDTRTLTAMASAFYIANPATQDRVKRQFREELSLFRTRTTLNGSPDTTAPSTMEEAFAHLLYQRFQHFFDLYKADRNTVSPSIESARIQQVEEDRLLDIITTHPSKAERNRLMRAPIPYVYAVTLDMGDEPPQKWPAAMVIKRTDRQELFLYSLEFGLQRFDSFQALEKQTRPFYKEQVRAIRDISSELIGHVFDVAAQELLHIQGAALERALSAPENATIAVRTFAKNLEDALVLPMLSLVVPLLVRVGTRIENNRPHFYKTAAPLQQAHYRQLEGRVMGAAYRLGDGVQKLERFASEKIKRFLKQTVHASIEPDPDKTMITLFSGKSVDPRNSRITSLTQLMLDNVRSPQYPNAMREVTTVYLVDQQGERIRHPATGLPITLAGPELAKMATTLDVGGRYEVLLREELNKPAYKAAWQAAYLANLKFKRYEATLKGSAFFKAEALDRTLKPPRLRKQLALWLRAILESPSAQVRPQVFGRRVHVYGLLLGGSVGVGGQNGTMGGAVSIDGALIFTDQDGPVIKGTVGVYFPDSPKGEDLHEFSDLSDGVAGLLQLEEWQAYFRSRIASADEEEIKKLLGQHRSRPLIRGLLITADFLDAYHRAHVNFHSAYADHRSTSNREIAHQTALRVGMAAVESVMDLVGLLFTPGFRLLKSAVEVGYRAFRTGIPMDLATLLRVHNLAWRIGRRSVYGAMLYLRGEPSFVLAAARQTQGEMLARLPVEDAFNRRYGVADGSPIQGVSADAQGFYRPTLTDSVTQDETLAGLPLEEALYRRYAVTDGSVIQGVSADAQGFYRPSLTNNVTGSVTRPVYVRQPDGTVFRVHDHTRLNATEATLVDPLTGLSIRSSGVMRSTVARMPNGEWRAVGFGQGGGKRPGETSPQPGPSKPKRPALSRVSDSIRMSGSWDNQIMDLVPAIMPRLPNWPQNRSLMIRDEISASHYWSVRYTPGQPESIYPMRYHPDEASSDIVLSRTAQNHYTLILDDRVVDIPADGDCFFNAVAQGLNEGQAQGTFSIQGLRNAAADYIEQHPELSHYLPAHHASGEQQALFENAASLKEFMGGTAFGDLTRIIHGAPNPHRLFQPLIKYLNRYIDNLNRRVLNQAGNTVLPAEVLQMIARHLSARSPGKLSQWHGPLSAPERQSLRNFLESTLLEPVEYRYIDEFLEDPYLVLRANQLHILLEYGVTSRELSWNYPLSDDAFVLFDEATHGQLDDDELEELVDSARLVTDDDLEDLQAKIKQVTGETVIDQGELLESYVKYQSADRTSDLYRLALRRFPDLQVRADILLASPILSWTLGGDLDISVFAGWLRNPALSNERLRLIAGYANSRYAEISEDGFLDIGWMQSLNDQNVLSIVTHQKSITGFMGFLGGARGDMRGFDIPAVARLFSVVGQPVSNARVSLLFATPGLWAAMQRFPRNNALQIWNELIGPYFSDANIRRALAQPGALTSELNFALALGAGLSAEEARANRIVRNLFGLGQSRSQQYLYNFDFPTDRLGHSRLDFALYLESHLEIPEWAWRYAREGVTPDSLKPFGAIKTPKPREDNPDS